MRLRKLLFALALAAASLTPASLVLAKCVTPPVELLWSYPSDGDTDVPTNAVFWSLNKHSYANPTLTLNGVPVATQPREPNASSAPGTPLGPLMAQHDYVLRLEFPTPVFSDGGTGQPIEIAFRTGDGPAERLEPVTATGNEQTPDGPDFSLAFLDAECAEEIRAQGCFDTGPNTLIHFDVFAPRAVAFRIDDKLWPARCGRPAIYHRNFARRTGDEFCFAVQAIGPAGLLTDATSYCLEPVGGAGGAGPATVHDRAPSRSSSGCAMSLATSERAGSSAPLVALAGLIAWRRKRHRKVRQNM